MSVLVDLDTGELLPWGPLTPRKARDAQWVPPCSKCYARSWVDGVRIVAYWERQSYYDLARSIAAVGVRIVICRSCGVPSGFAELEDT